MYLHSNRSRFAILAPLGLLLPAIGCSDSDNNDRPPIAVGQVEFTSMLDQAQELPAPVAGTRVRVTITNRAPANGTFQTPVWIGFHDGQFDLYDSGSPASLRFPTGNALERLAEDGNFGPLTDAFAAADTGGTQTALRGELGPAPGPIAPGETVSVELEFDPSNPASRFFSYASMVIPSNDAFVANGGPRAHEIFDASGAFVATDFVVRGSEVLDAGTEVNDELPANTAFFGQAAPDTGDDEGLNVTTHAGFMAPGAGGILDDPMFAAADFTASGYETLSFQFAVIDAAPAPTGVALVGLNSTATEVEFSIAASGLSGPAAAIHFHNGAAGSTGPVIVNLTDEIVTNTNGEFLAEGSVAVSETFVERLRGGNIYINVHTALNPSGELRGQVEAGEVFRGEIDTAQEVPAPSLGQSVRVTMTNRAPASGTFHTPVWVGFHGGMFDIYNLGSPADTTFPSTNALEGLAEDGSVGPIRDAFGMNSSGSTDGVLAGILGPAPGPIAPGETVSAQLRVDPAAGRFFSYATMVIPSNDAFVANAGPQAHEVFDASGAFVGSGFTVSGSSARDAGTEVNDEAPANTAFFGQTAANTGVTEGGNVVVHPGFMAVGAGGILADPMFANADFTAGGYTFLDVSFADAGAGAAGAGVIVATLNDSATELTFSIQARDLSGDVQAMHFHDGAAGIAGPVLVNITDNIVRNSDGRLMASGTVTVDEAFVTALRDGRVYVNVHTALNPSGELRGQVTLAQSNLGA